MASHHRHDLFRLETNSNSNEEQRKFQICCFVWLIIRLDMHERIIVVTLTGNSKNKASESWQFCCRWLRWINDRLWPLNRATYWPTNYFSHKVNQRSTWCETQNKFKSLKKKFSFVVYHKSKINSKATAIQPQFNQPLTRNNRSLNFLSRDSHFTQSFLPSSVSILFTCWAFCYEAEATADNRSTSDRKRCSCSVINSLPEIQSVNVKCSLLATVNFTWSSGGQQLIAL